MKRDAAMPPIVEELSPAPAAREAFLRFCGLPHVLFLDSARRDAELGRYSFLAADPFDFLTLQPQDADAFSQLTARLRSFSAPTIAGLPPFQGGAAGLLSYDLNRQLENIPASRIDEFQLPALAVGMYDVVLAWDHQSDRAWLISHGFPEADDSARLRRAHERLAMFRARLELPRGELSCGMNAPPIPLSTLAPSFPTGPLPGLLSNFSEQAYLAAVERAIEYIRAGDIFQVNLAQRLLIPATDHAAQLYLRLRERNPATFAAYFDGGPWQIASASPERYLRVVDRHVETRPIKGTRPRTARPEADLFSGDELRESVKDRAENVMIVDLLRNDLSKACRADSVRVNQLCRVENYEFVQHLVSSVEGTLRDECQPLDLLRLAFPGGSITGAPKVRAMQIIAELEPTARGPYCGSLFYHGFNGDLDSSILIRTVTAAGGWWQAPMGGGIVAQSDARREYEETWHKAAGILRAFEA